MCRRAHKGHKFTCRKDKDKKSRDISFKGVWFTLKKDENPKSRDLEETKITEEHLRMDHSGAACCDH